jgi:hypothetical protein
METNLDNPVVILSPGRSGSTLLQRYLNTSKELVIWGEHGGLLVGLANTYYGFINDPNAQRNLPNGRNHVSFLLSSKPVTNRGIEWTNNFGFAEFQHGMKDFLYQLFSHGVEPDQRWGFKEIRYKEQEISFLNELFPQIQYLMIARDPQETVASMIAAWGKDNWPVSSDGSNEQSEIVNRFATRVINLLRGMNDFSAQHDNCFILPYDQLDTHPDEEMSKVADFLKIEQLSVDEIHTIASSALSVTKKGAILEDIRRFHNRNEVMVELANEYARYLSLIQK